MTIWKDLQDNRRLRGGVVLIAVIAVSYALLEWRDYNDGLLSDYKRQLGQLARQSRYQGERQWLQRVVEVTGVLALARERLWRDKSTGLAQAQVQDWLTTLLRQTDAKSATVKVVEVDSALEAGEHATKLPDSLGRLRQIRARVEFGTDVPVLLAVLAGLNDAPHAVVVDVMNVKPSRTDLSLSFWFELEAQPEPSAGTRRP